MGLLDEAIREHLELKRRRGADPGEIAHEEHAALDPIFPAEQPLVADEPGDGEPVGGDAEIEGARGGQRPSAADSQTEAEPPPGGELHVAQETAELDMQAVLDGDDSAAAEHRAAGPEVTSGRTETHAAAPPQEGDAFEWELPGGDVQPDEHQPEPAPGQERMPFE
jgi:hypothetical protein